MALLIKNQSFMLKKTLQKSLLYPFKIQFELKFAKMWARGKEKIPIIILVPNSHAYHVTFYIIVSECYYQQQFVAINACVFLRA